MFFGAGHEVVIIKGGCRICGSGGALASAPLVQSKSYFEVKLQQSGKWSMGLATRKADLNKTQGGTDAESWCLTSDNIVQHDGKEIHKLSTRPSDTNSSLDNINNPIQGMTIETGIPTEGDTLGVAYDHVELNFYLNGKKLDIPVLNIRGTVYPALYGKLLYFLNPGIQIFMYLSSELYYFLLFVGSPSTVSSIFILF